MQFRNHLKVSKVISLTILIPALFLASCSAGGAQNAVSRLQSLANQAQVAMAVRATDVQPGELSSAPVTNVVDQAQQAATATPAATGTAAVIPVTSGSKAPVASNAALAALEGTLEQIYAQVNPSVVNIQVVSGGGVSSGRFSQGTQEALGSGFVWDDQGHIVTNNHVVDGATQITVTFASGTTYTARLVGADPNADLAVIKISAPTNELHPVTLADSTQVKVGQLAIAIGNPFGLSGTMTEGIVSALSRSLPVGLDNNNSQSGQSQLAPAATYAIPDIIQTDAAINPGNSGGVLVNDQGQVIGVTAAMQSSTNSNSGIGFVIPSAIVNRVVPSLIKTGSYQHPYMGISGVSVDADVISALNLKANQRGVLIIDISSGSPAERAGLHGSSQSGSSSQAVPVGGDIITAVNGHAINGIDDLTSYLFNNTQVGQAVTLTILRQGREQTAKVTLGALPNPSGQ
jgi:serine protease Do